MMSLQHRRDRAYGKKGKGMMSLQEEKERNGELTGSKGKELRAFRKNGNGMMSLPEERNTNDELTGR
jgi:hypothetical protein